MSRKDRLCSINGCGDKHAARGYCQHHYDLARRAKSPISGKRTARNGDHERWIKNAAASDASDCILWPFGKNASGYGHTRHNDRQTGPHRVVCELRHGAPPFPWAEAAHSCNNRACCNPNHLRWATSLSNHDDKRAAGTISRGEALPQTVLTRSQVIQIDAQLSTRRKTHIARDFGVSIGTIINIANGQTWSWLTGRTRGGGQNRAA